MKLPNARVVLTGASRGLGAVLADALAARGAHLLLIARSRADLEAVAKQVSRHGTRVLTLPADLGDATALEGVVAHAQRELGAIDVLINNAGLEKTGFYEDLTPEEISEVIALNLTTPMVLTRMVLPGMLARDRGHILNVASIAGIGPFAFGETYGATKHGLVGFTRSLRASLKERASRVSASALCPGFVSDTGMYQEARDRYGVATHWLLGSCTSKQVADDAIRAIERDEPEVVVNSTPLRNMAALGMALPRISEIFTRTLDVNGAARQLAYHRRAERKSET